MATYNLTMNLGSGDEGLQRTAAYKKDAEKDGMTVNAWAKKALDQKAGFKHEKTELGK